MATKFICALPACWIWRMQQENIGSPPWHGFQSSKEDCQGMKALLTLAPSVFLLPIPPWSGAAIIPTSSNWQVSGESCKQVTPVLQCPTNHWIWTICTFLTTISTCRAFSAKIFYCNGSLLIFFRVSLTQIIFSTERNVLFFKIFRMY